MVANTEKQAFARRFALGLDYAGIKQGDGRPGIVAQAFPFTLSREGARQWLAGDTMPDGWKIPVIADTLGIRAEWLLTGKGLMVDEETIHKDDTLSQLIAIYGSMSDEDRQRLLQQAQQLKAGQAMPDKARRIELPHQQNVSENQPDK